VAGTKPQLDKPYQVIARKYRPQRFDELLGQDSVRVTIENAIGQRRIAHGYIFSGQRGTGKTTVARILARCLNCQNGPTAHPCGECSSCQEVTAGNAMDVIEIDAASNRGINEMRELRENVKFRPARDRYKVFIIDEAHQITNEAFNALLKTLEEPPEWVVFILCTTESHKIPTTIASRCQQFSFRSVDFQTLTSRLREICASEDVTADEEALAVIAQSGEGSVRDSLSALDQAIAACGATLEGARVRQLLGRFSIDALGRVSDALSAGDGRVMLDIAGDLESSGQSLQQFCRELARYFRNLLVSKIAGADTRLIAATTAEQSRLAAVAQQFSEEDLTRYLQLSLDLFRDLQYSLQPRLHMELGLVRMVHAGRLRAIEDVIAQIGGGAAPGGTARVATPTASTPLASPAAAARPAAEPPGGDTLAVNASLKAKIHALLVQAGNKFSADAIENAAVIETAGAVQITASQTDIFSL
jgi:DNA polymerase-3 subunit gamma/tau